MKQLLSTNEIETKLRKLPLEWSVIGGTVLTRKYEFADFKRAVEFVHKMSGLIKNPARAPKIEIHQGDVIVEISTEEMSGLTTQDFTLAKSVEEAM